MIEKLKRSDNPFTVVDNRVVQGLTNSDALAIWAYLQSMPKDWVVVAEHLLKHFDFGRTRYRKAVKQLREAGLWEIAIERDEQGRIKVRTVTVKASASPQGGVIVTEEKRPTTKETNIIQKKQNIQGFYRFVSIHPRVEQKAGCAKVWRTKNLEPLTDVLIADIQDRLNSVWADRETKFIPSALSYLNNEIWKDDKPKREVPSWI